MMIADDCHVRQTAPTKQTFKTVLLLTNLNNGNEKKKKNAREFHGSTLSCSTVMSNFTLQGSSC